MEYKGQTGIIECALGYEEEDIDVSEVDWAAASLFKIGCNPICLRDG